MSEKQLLLYKPGAFKPSDLKKMAQAGFVCVEATDFEAYKIVEPSIPFSGAELLKTAMAAISTANGQVGSKTRLGELLSEKMSK